MTRLNLKSTQLSKPIPSTHCERTILEWNTKIIDETVHFDLLWLLLSDKRGMLT